MPALSPITQFILSQPMTKPAAKVVAAAKKAGVTTTTSNVYQVRRGQRQRLARRAENHKAVATHISKVKTPAGAPTPAPQATKAPSPSKGTTKAPSPAVVAVVGTPTSAFAQELAKEKNPTPEFVLRLAAAYLGVERAQHCLEDVMSAVTRIAKAPLDLH